MIYKDFMSKKLSALGFGAMRLPTVGNSFDAPIDEQQTAEMVAYAVENGVNYFDTAYGYHNGQSEVVMGNILRAYPRESYYLADKFPGYDLANMGKVAEIFEEQLVKTGMDYFDFYLFHNVCELNIEGYLDEKNGILAYLRKQKQLGRIKHLGFSTHGQLDNMKRFLEAYGSEMEFCQIQLNYLDWKLQQAKEKVELLCQYNIPVWVMEPLRGGKLAALSVENTTKLKALRPDESVPAWAFRFLQAIPGVIVTLSGMSNSQQLEENIATMSEDKPASEQELSALAEIADGLLSMLPCTACGYCLSHRSCKLNIPNLMFMYNELCFSNGFITHMGIGAMPEGERPSACTACGKCNAVCPQQIKISTVMADFVEKMKKPMVW